MPNIKRIDADRFDDMLYTLPPEQWTQEKQTETFRFEERLDFEMALWYCRLGNEFFELEAEIDSTHDEIVWLCESLL